MADNGKDAAPIVFYGPPAKWAEFRADGSLFVAPSVIDAGQVAAFIKWLLENRPMPELPEVAEGEPAP